MRTILCRRGCPVLWMPKYEWRSCFILFMKEQKNNTKSDNQISLFKKMLNEYGKQQIRCSPTAAFMGSDVPKRPEWKEIAVELLSSSVRGIGCDIFKLKSRLMLLLPVKKLQNNYKGLSWRPKVLKSLLWVLKSGKFSPS